MKKTLVIILSSFMIVIIGATSIFADDSLKTSDTTDISYTKDETYTWTVPSSVEFSNTSLEQTGNVEISKLVLNSGKQLEIALSSGSCEKSATTYQLSTEEGAKHSYSIKANSADVPNQSVVLTATAAEGAEIETTPKKIQLTFAADKLTYAGEYKDTLTFTANVVEKVSVTLDYNGGMVSGETSKTISLKKGDKVENSEIPTTVIYGDPKNVEGWYTEKEGGTKFDFSNPINESITLYAHLKSNLSGLIPVAATVESSNGQVELSQDEIVNYIASVPAGQGSLGAFEVTLNGAYVITVRIYIPGANPGDTINVTFPSGSFYQVIVGQDVTITIEITEETTMNFFLVA